MTRKYLAVLALAAAALVGCGKDSPTDVGGSLLPGGAVRTFELVLDAPSFLVSDTTVSGFRNVFGAGFFIVANGFGGALDAHILGRWSTPPTSISVVDSSGTTRSDTLPRYIGGQLVLLLDTAAVAAVTPVQLAAYTVTEAWDPSSVTWDLRVDTAGTRLPWQTPGGTLGARIDTAVWSAGADSVVFSVDSATFAALTDTARGPARGVVVVAETPGARLKATSLLLRGLARPTVIQKDTVVAAQVTPEGVTFVSTPAAPPPTNLRIGGLPPWRSYLEFTQGLKELTVPCPGTGVGCTIRLDRATLNYAALLLDPVPPPAGFLVEDSVAFGAATVRTSPLLPLVRSPLGSQVGGSTKLTAPDLFASASASTPVEIAVTPFIQSLLSDTTATGSPNAPSRFLALVEVPEPATFGIATFFGADAGARAPRLRLIVTVASEVQLP